jgi:WD40 repeat protein
MVWDLVKNELLKLKGHTDIIHFVDFGFHKDILASAASDGTIRLWDMNSQRCFETVNLKNFDKPGMVVKGQLKYLKVALLKDEIVYLDNLRGLCIFKVFISRATCFSMKSRHIKMWSKYMGEYWLNRIEISREIIFNALIMDAGENVSTYNLLIENDVNSLVRNKNT